MSSSDHSFKLAANPASVSSLKIPEVHTAASAVQLTNQQLIHISAGGVIMPQQPPVASATTVSQVPDYENLDLSFDCHFELASSGLYGLFLAPSIAYIWKLPPALTTHSCKGRRVSEKVVDNLFGLSIKTLTLCPK